MYDLVGTELPLTQEFLAQMMGVRRTSVTQVATQLQKEGLISYRGGKMNIVSIDLVQQRACNATRLFESCLLNCSAALAAHGVGQLSCRHGDYGGDDGNGQDCKAVERSDASKTKLPLEPSRARSVGAAGAYSLVVDLGQHEVLAETHQRKVYFPHTGIHSCVVELVGGGAIETTSSTASGRVRQLHQTKLTQ
jgi:hypothetical protein